jgi:hypothetical protein
VAWHVRARSIAAVPLTVPAAVTPMNRLRGRHSRRLRFHFAR